MFDFLVISSKPTKTGVDIFPKFKLYPKSKDLMIRGGDFYAIWLEEEGKWSTEESDALNAIDRELDRYMNENKEQFGDGLIRVLHMWDSDSGMIDKWHKFCQKQSRDSFHVLDETLVFANSPTNKEDYSSKHLPYALEPCDISSYELLMSTLYAPEERHKLEWAIGAIVTGESKELQKFLVLYGAPKTGKSTILNIIQMLFDGYYSVFDAKALGSSGHQFALEAFKTNPLVAIQHDGDLSRIEDNTRLNSLVSHEWMEVNEKYKSSYSQRFKAFLFLGTNKPVKITDSKSGLLRRLIDVTPTGDRVPRKEYDKAVRHIKFELGGIACHCRDVYLENPNYYDDYVPTHMMVASNDFYNFIIDSYHVFVQNDGTTLETAWKMYNQYCEDAKVPYPYTKRVFKEELRTYFKGFEDGPASKCRYTGFKIDIFEKKKEKKDDRLEPKTGKSWIVLEDGQSSIFDKQCAGCPAQYATKNETPKQAWDKVVLRLKDIDTHKLHYVKVPINHIVIDFDLTDEEGCKSLERNLMAANEWPETYAEVSKGGQGLHLHYIYTGDPEELSRIFADSIEIKVFTGNMSLRRKLTKCNDKYIATISSGLPLREVKKKMIDFTAYKNEKAIRTIIKKSLNKEYPPHSTKCSIDFIKDTLDKAYASGLSYDVSDFENSIIAFAAQSTHQSDYCLKQVPLMKFKSEDIVPVDPIQYDTESLVFYDVEVFPNLFLVCYKMRGPGKPVVRMYNPKPEEVEDILKFSLVGFNCRRYDNHMLYACTLGYSNEQLFNLSQKIINSGKGENREYFFGPAYNISYTDIYDFASAGNKKSLKKLEIEMGIHHQELGFPWDQPVPEDKWELVGDYCENDVIATEAAFDYLKADWIARQILADLAGMTVNDTTNTLTTKIIFGNNKKPQSQFHYRNLADPVLELESDMEAFLKEACPKMMEHTHGDAHSLLPYFPGYEYKAGKSTYKGIEVGEGGLVIAEPGMYGNAALLDISSMHPHSAIAECLFGVKYTRAFRDIVEGRVSIKHEAWDQVDQMLDGKLRPYIDRVKAGEFSSDDLANALKTAINSVYGLTKANFDCAFRDIRNKDNIVAKRGALFMVDLAEEVRKRGFIVAHIKTDSIKIPDATPEIIQFVMEFGERYGYSFEHEATYDRMCLVNDAVYIAKYKDAEECQKMYGYVPKKNAKKGGSWDATGKQFQVPYVFKTLFSKEEITFDDMCETFSVKSALYLDMNETLPDVTEYEKKLDKLESDYKKGKLSDTMFEPEAKELAEQIADGHDYHFVGRVGQFCPVKPGEGGGLLRREQNGKYYAATGTTGYRWMESEMIRGLDYEKIIDRSYYETMVNDAVDAISKYCDFEWFVSDDPYVSPPRNDFMNVPEDAPEELPWDEVA